MKHVLVIGGGLAGLAAAAELTRQGLRATILESRNRLGGRAGSFQDAASGQLVDACQHVSMGCCTAFAEFCRTVGIEHLISPEPVLFFMTPDQRISRFEADRIPAPFHLTRSFWRAHYLSLADKIRIAWGLLCLRFASGPDRPFQDWLSEHRQTSRTIERFWSVVLVSALNERVDRVGLRYARKVFVDAFLTDRRGFVVQVPSVPLGRLYGEELHSWSRRAGVSLETNAGVSKIRLRNDRVESLLLRDGSERRADGYVAAVPSARLLDMFPAETVRDRAEFQKLDRLEASPITSVHLWYDRPITRLPHVVFVDCLSQWLFNRGESAPGEHYVQVVISASRELAAQGSAVARDRVTEELGRLFPEAARAEVKRYRVITEHAATFVPVPGVDNWRPGPQCGIANLALAGDWTATGWPATMEGAVRSGTAAGREIAALLAGNRF